MAITAPRLLPEEMPRISGLAIGLRKSPCMTTPHTAREEPARQGDDNAGETKEQQDGRVLVRGRR